MLSIGNRILKIDDYYVKHILSGLDELIFDIPIYDDDYQFITEEAVIKDRDGQTYRVKAIDGGGESAKVKCVLNLAPFFQSMMVPYNQTGAPGTLINNVLPAGWMLFDHSTAGSVKIEMDAATPYAVIEQVRDTAGIYVRFDNKLKRVDLYDTSIGQPSGAFATRELNLTQIDFKGKSTEIVTRLYAQGKDGLTFAAINDGKAYVDNFSFTSEIICGFWKDEDYIDPQALLDAATQKVAVSSQPARSYACSVVDLAKTNPGVYNFLEFGLMRVITLIDDARGTAVNHEIVEYQEYPYYPEKNVVTLSTVPPRIQTQLSEVRGEMFNPNSSFRTMLTNQINAATGNILDFSEGYVILDTDTDGHIYQILIMDTPDKATATKVWRWNQGGLGFSATGYNGPFTTAITQDGAIVADFITTGSMNAARITAGILDSVNGRVVFDLDTGTITIKNAQNQNLFYFDGAGNLTIKGNLDGATGTFAGSLSAATGTFKGQLQAATGSFSGQITANSGTIGGWTIKGDRLQTDGASLWSDFNGDGVIQLGPMALISDGYDLTVGFVSGSAIIGNMHFSWSDTMQPNFLPGGAGIGNIGLGNDYWDQVKANRHPTGSSIRYKENVETATDDEIGTVDDVRIVTFELKEHKDRGRQMGIIAEELEPLCPYAVTHDEEGKPDGIEYGKLALLAIREIQRLKAEINELKNRG